MTSPDELALDKFLGLTADRIPTAEELAALCEYLGLRLLVDNLGGISVMVEPSIKTRAGCQLVDPDDVRIADAVVKLANREPFRSGLREILSRPRTA